MITSKRSDFFYTLEEDEQKYIASIQTIEQMVKKKTLAIKMVK